MKNKHGGKRFGSGRPALKTKRKMTSFRLHPDSLDLLNIIAEKRKITKGAVIEMLLDCEIDRHDYNVRVFKTHAFDWLN